jgi:hypothetical protein
MTIGTRSVLFGAHCFFLHPFFVAWGWTKLYGFPFDPRLWVAFFVHDLGYIGLPNMDGDEGEAHPILGARIMSRLFDPRREGRQVAMNLGGGTWIYLGPWGQFSVYHSRFYARRHGAEPSKLCYADKLAIVLTPRWLYLPMVHWTGEVDEYLAHHLEACRGEGKYARDGGTREAISSPIEWHDRMVRSMIRWIGDNEPTGAGARLYG